LTFYKNTRAVFFAYRLTALLLKATLSVRLSVFFAYMWFVGATVLLVKSNFLFITNFYYIALTRGYLLNLAMCHILDPPLMLHTNNERNLAVAGYCTIASYTGVDFVSNGLRCKFDYRI